LRSSWTDPWRDWRRCGLPVPPRADEHLGVHEAQVYRRALGYPAPLKDAPVELGGRVADLLLAAQVLDLLGQPFDLLAQLQRGRQELRGRHALPVQVIPQPGLAVLFALGKRPAGAGEIIEGTPLCRLVDLPVDPRGEADPWRLALCHV